MPLEKEPKSEVGESVGPRQFASGKILWAHYCACFVTSTQGMYTSSEHPQIALPRTVSIPGGQTHVNMAFVTYTPP